jgi:hypothetical protein
MGLLTFCHHWVHCSVQCQEEEERRRRRRAQVILQVPYSSSSMCLFWTHKGPTGERVLLLLWS